MYCRIIGKNQIATMLICFVIAALTFAAAFSGASGGAVPATADSNRLLPVYSVGRSEDDKVISISFDAAWGNEDTQTLIDILERYNVKATFFVVGEWVDKYPESVKALANAGHEIMNHSSTHPHMSKLSREQIRREIEDCNDKIEAITGIRPTLFRAPFGEYCNELIEVLDELGMTCVQWDVDSLDWKDPPPSAITERVCSRVCPGSICLFHNAAVNTPAALPSVIETLQSKGYKIVPISQNVYYENFTIDHEGRQQPDTPERAAVNEDEFGRSAQSAQPG